MPRSNTRSRKSAVSSRLPNADPSPIAVRRRRQLLARRRRVREGEPARPRPPATTCGRCGGPAASARTGGRPVHRPRPPGSRGPPRGRSGRAAAAPARQRLPERLDADTERADDADAGDRDGDAHAPRPRTSVTLWPPKPYDDVTATSLALAAAGHRHQVEIAPRRVGCMERRRRREELTVEREDRRRGLDRARRAQAVTEL